jgi:hypothetical protein
MGDGGLLWQWIGEYLPGCDSLLTLVPFYLLTFLLSFVQLGGTCFKTDSLQCCKLCKIIVSDTGFRISSTCFDDDGVIHRPRGDSKLPTTRLKRN